MIELLMVILIISMLGAVALPQFLDFRKEAKTAALRENLNTMRVGFKNQMLQIKLKCNNLGSVQRSGTYSTAGIPSQLSFAILSNNITFFSGHPTHQVCTTSEIPNTEDRKFWSLPTSQYAGSFFYTSPVPHSSQPIPQNPFATDTGYSLESIPFGVVGAFTPITDAEIQAEGGNCGIVDLYNQFYRSYYHWHLNADTGEIFPGTNTPGVNECNF